jgi:ribosomal protein L11 methyltransferase
VSDQTWFAVKIVVTPEAADAVEHFLNELDALGTEIDQLRKKPDEDVTVVGYFSLRPDETAVRDQLEFTLSAFELPNSFIRSVEIASVENQDWLAEWKKHWRPTRVGRFLIAPSWEKVEEDAGTILIRIEPNMAFGTGTHETTKLCLKAIDEHFEPRMSFLDVGTGTGILAIAAAKMNGDSNAEINAYDVDRDSVAIARENARVNGVADNVRFFDGGVDETTPIHDFVCANVTLDVISPILELLLTKSRKKLVLSGILAEQKRQIISRLSTLRIVAPLVEQDGEWISVLVDR